MMRKTVSVRLFGLFLLAAAPIVIPSASLAAGFGVRGCAALFATGFSVPLHDAAFVGTSRFPNPSTSRDGEMVQGSMEQCRPGKRRTAAHSKAGAMHRQRVMLRCAGPPDAADDDIRGPRPAVEIPVPGVFPFTRWLIGAGVLAAAALLFRWWRRRRGRLRGTAPLDRAMQELATIDRERNNLEAGPLADKAAGVVRRFIAERFSIAAPQRTTEEFLRSLTGDASPLRTHAELLRGFLQSCDMAKFAGLSFDAAERHALLESAFRFVRATSEQPPSAP